jgi:NTE family protein
MRALVQSGGGSKGAFQVGVLKHLLSDLNINYDIFCGVSVGAINASYLAMFSGVDQKQAYEGLYKLWFELSTPSVYKRWFPFGRLHGLWKTSMYNTSPLRDLILNNLNASSVRVSGKQLRIGAASLTTGEYKIFDQNCENLVDAVMASSAFPVMFAPVQMENQLWIDGGVREVTPIKTAIDAGATEIDIILTGPQRNALSFPSKPSSLDVGVRCLDIMNNEIIADDLRLAEMYNLLVDAGKAPGKKKVTFRMFQPKVEPHDNPLDFSHGPIMKMMEQGYLEALEVVSKAV